MSTFALVAGSLDLVILALLFKARQAIKKCNSLNQQLVRSNKTKEQFLALLSHELRGPLTPILGIVDLWKKRKDFPKEISPDIQIFDRSLRMIQKIIDDLLDLARISSGNISFEIERVNVHKALEFMLGSLTKDFQKKNIRVLRNLSASAYQIQGDFLRVSQIFLNIFTNALKFTPKDGFIQVITRNNKNYELEIVIRDSGSGMSKETLDNLFMPTKSYSNSLGLGLSICYHFCKVMGGKIFASSPGIGKGTAIKLVFPTVDQIATMHQEFMDKTDINLPKFKVLLVEDHFDTATILERALSLCGGEVKLARNFNVGLQLVQNEKFGLFVFDLGLPDGSGVELIQEARKIKLQTPAIALTGYGMPEDIKKCKDSGFDLHLCKPVSFSVLQDALNDVMSKKPEKNKPIADLAPKTDVKAGFSWFKK